MLLTILVIYLAISVFVFLTVSAGIKDLLFSVILSLGWLPILIIGISYEIYNDYIKPRISKK